MSYKDIATTLFMCEKSVQRYLALFHGTGAVTPQPPTGGPSKVLNDLEEFTIMQSIIYKPTIYLHEVQEHLYNTTGKWVSASTVCRTIKAKDFTRKKVQVIALQQSEQRRIEFMVQVAATHSPDMFIWIDETGSDRRNSIRKYGYSLRGITPRVCQLHVSGKRISAIPVLTTRGIEDLYLTSGSVNGDIFEDFICQCVLPILLPYNGHNPRSVVLIDNASIHHLDRVQEIITGCGARLCFLPPYSPDLMPLEEVFSKVKYMLKANDSLFRVTTDPELLIKLAFSSVTQQDCIGYIRP